MMIRACREFAADEQRVKLVAYVDDGSARVFIVPTDGKKVVQFKGSGIEFARKAWIDLQADLKRKGFKAGKTVVWDTTVPF